MFFFKFTVKVCNQRSQDDSYFEVDYQQEMQCVQRVKKMHLQRKTMVIFSISCWQMSACSFLQSVDVMEKEGAGRSRTAGNRWAASNFSVRLPNALPLLMV